MDVLDVQQQLNKSLDGLDTGSLSDDELSLTLVGLVRGARRTAAQIARLMGVYDKRRVFRSDGSKSAAARLARETNSAPGEMRRQVRESKWLRVMLKVAAALAAGEIGLEHVRVLGRLACSDRDPVARAFPNAEEQLLGYAKTLPFKDFEKALKYWEQLVDQDGTEEKAERLKASRRLHLSKGLDGEWFLDGKLDPVGGTQVAKALRRIEKELFEDDWAEARAEHGDDTRMEHLKRTAAQRRADALTELASRAMAAPAGSRLPSPLFVVHVGYETFHGRLCELADGTVIPPGQLFPLMSGAELERVVFDAPNRIIELSQRTRFFTGGLRQVIEIRDRHCQHPSGCDVPADECDVDHIKEYSKGGLTQQSNGRSYCDTHNWWEHNHGDHTSATIDDGNSASGTSREPPPHHDDSG